jgi:hypothetical protein
MTVLLYLPLFIELFAYPLFEKIQPEWLSVLLFFVCYTYVFYGAAIFVYHRWRKRIGQPVNWKPEASEIKTLLVALAAGIIFRRLQLFIFQASQTPMIIMESIGYIKNTPYLWMGIAGFLLQEIYYIFEFTLAACIVDCAQRAGENIFRNSKKIPWGGIFLGLTWGLQHTITKNDWLVGISSLLLSLLMGCMYTYSRKKPNAAWVTIAAAYLL